MLGRDSEMLFVGGRTQRERERDVLCKEVEGGGGVAKFPCWGGGNERHRQRRSV